MTFLPWRVAPALVASAAISHGDVLDDLGLTPAAAAMACDSRLGPESDPVLIGLPVSPEHEEAIASMLRPGSAVQITFWESRGRFDKALQGHQSDPFVKARLQLRAGRADEAAATLAAAAAPDVADVRQLVRTLCRPLEDAEDWEILLKWLPMLAQQFAALPGWRDALWREELDVAFHRGRLPELLQTHRDDPLRLAAFHHWLGNDAERDALLPGLLDAAETARLVEIVSVLRDAGPVRRAAAEHWHREIAPDLRLALFSASLEQPWAPEFSSAFTTWLDAGGDATPLIPPLWRWMAFAPHQRPVPAEVQAALVRRHPEHPAVRLLEAWRLVPEDPEAAAEHFLEVARGPLGHRPAAPVRYGPVLVPPVLDGPGQPTLTDDLPFLGFRGLGHLNRQDLIAKLVAEHPDWAGLAVPERVRYLATGLMDHELVREILTADPEPEAHDELPRMLLDHLRFRGETQKIPPATVEDIAAGLPRLYQPATGRSRRLHNARLKSFIDLFRASELPPEDWRPQLQRVIDQAAEIDPQRASDLFQELPLDIRNEFTAPPPPPPRAPRVSDPFAWFRLRGRPDPQASAIARWLDLLLPPEICRVELYPPGRFNRFGGGLPAHLLTRWSQPEWAHRPFPGEVPPLAVMKLFPDDHPRRVLVNALAMQGSPRPEVMPQRTAAAAGLSEVINFRTPICGTEAFAFVFRDRFQGKPEELRAVIERVKTLPPAVQLAFASAVRSEPLQQEYSKELVASAWPQAAPPRSETDPEVARTLEKLRAHDDEGRPTPEAVALAKPVLDEEARRNAPQLSPQGYQAAAVLRQGRDFDAWLEAAEEKVAAGELPELGVLRVERHAGRRGRNAEAALARSRRILELAPDDAEAARDLAPVAAQTGDFELLLACLQADGSNALAQLGRPEVLASLSLENAPKVLAVVAQTAGRLGGQIQSIEALHGYFLQASPELAGRFRQWLARDPEAFASYRQPLAAQLAAAGHRPEAAQLLTALWSVPARYPGHPHQFPPKANQPTPRHMTAANVIEKFGPNLDFLESTGLLGDVLAAMDGSPETAAPVIHATFRMAAEPTAAGWEKASPRVAGLPPSDLSRLLEAWRELFLARPDTAPLVEALFRAEMTLETPWAFHHTASLMEQSFILRDAHALRADLWSRLMEKVATERDGADRIAGMMGHFFVLADDDLWQAYWAWREPIQKPLNFIHVDEPWDSSGPAGTPERWRAVLPRLLAEWEKNPPNPGYYPISTADALAAGAAATGDAGLISRSRALVPADARSARTLLDLAVGRTDAVIPAFTVRPGAERQVRIAWNLATLAPPAENYPGRTVPFAELPALDGKFTLSVLSGPTPEQLARLREIPGAAHRGEVTLELPEGQRFVALLAQDAGSGAVRMTAPEGVNFEAIHVEPDAGRLAEPRFRRMENASPWGGPAWSVSLTGSETHTLIDQPYPGSGAVDFRAWVCGDGRIELRCYDIENKLLAHYDANAWQMMMPLWGQFQHAKGIPNVTARLEVVATTNSPRTVPDTLHFSEIQLEIGPPQPLPKGAVQLVRLPGPLRGMQLSTDGRWLAGLLGPDVVLVDLEARNWRRVPPPPQMSWQLLTWSGNRLVALRHDGALVRIEPQAPDAPEWIARPGTDIAQLAASADGKWLVWINRGADLHLHSPGFGAPRCVSRGVYPAEVAFVEKGLRFRTFQNQRMLLSRGRFTAGEPEAGDSVPAPPAAPEWVFQNQRPPQGSLAKSLPVQSSQTVFAADGAAIYVDEAGNVVRVSP